MVTNFDYIKRWLYDNKVKNFTVWETSKSKEDRERSNGNAIKFISDDPLEDKIERFSDWCDNNSGSYTICQADGNGYNSELKFILPFRREEKPTAIAGIPAGYISEQEFNTRMENERLKMRIERLEEELKRCKDATEKGTATDEFLRQVTPFVGPVLNGIFGKKQVVQIGALDIKEDDPKEDSEDLDISEEEFRRLTEDLKRWKEADKDYLDLIHKLSKFTSDPMYKTAKTMLLNK